MKDLIRKNCINKCGRKVLLKRKFFGSTPSKECGYCRTYGKEKSKQLFKEFKEQFKAVKPENPKAKEEK